MRYEESWGEKLAKYRYDAGFKSCGAFSTALSFKGYDISQNTLNKYEVDHTRIPKKRERLLELLEVLVEKKAITSRSQANSWLQLAGQPPLMLQEIESLFGSTDLMKEVELLLVGNFDKFTEREREFKIRLIANILEVDPSIIKFRYAMPGSIKLGLEMPDWVLKKLKLMLESQNPLLQKLDLESILLDGETYHYLPLKKHEASGYLQVKLLGKTVFQRTGNREPFRKSLRLSILGYLIREGQPVSRKRLSRIFWPHLSNSDSRTYLRNILARLKSDFSPWLDIDRETVYFNSSIACEIDLYELENILTRYEHIDLEKLGHEQLNELRDGLLTFYRGPFMDDLSRTISPWFEEWLRSERQFILSRVLKIYSKLIEARIYSRAWNEGIQDARHMISLDPDHSESWLLLMRCLTSSGDLIRAQEMYERYERTPAIDIRLSAANREMSILYRKIGQRISGIGNFDMRIEDSI